MTDRELLELAAKAAGIPECGWMGSVFVYVDSGAFKEWSPLTDDGDALRLAVKLRMRIEQSSDYSVCYSGTCMAEQFTASHSGGDACAATRRAIVRAAAEIGRAMP